MKLTFLILSMSSVLMLSAQSPYLLNIQGALKTSNGTVLPDGPQVMAFRLYEQAQGGSSIWAETVELNLTGGIYNHYLGSENPINAGIFSKPLYLGIAVGGVELTPRSVLTAAPYGLTQVGCKGALGDIKMSALPPAQFIAENGDCWVELDGRELSQSDRLLITTGRQEIPDARGTFLRSIDERGSNGLDPDRGANPVVGSFQADVIRGHNHTVGQNKNLLDGTFKMPVPFDWSMPNLGGYSESVEILDVHVDATNCYGNVNGGNFTMLWGPAWNGDGAVPANYPLAETFTKETNILNHSHEISETGGSETRPDNVNLYTYIRIR
ncbi:MAG: hypothetical protein ACE362_18075 [Phaeodactylibacter xiamenensis]|nr:hypothetical protein [Phaeodactylibacter xiamenensis]MCR9053449.1 hypothetical protein [bacterium]